MAASAKQLGGATPRLPSVSDTLTHKTFVTDERCERVAQTVCRCVCAYGICVACVACHGCVWLAARISQAIYDVFSFSHTHARTERQSALQNADSVQPP